jgi:hypothetical protein
LKYICLFFFRLIVSAAYGVLFTEHASAFSNFRLWESLGFVIACVYTPRIRLRYAQIILLCVLTLSMICYGIIDIKERRRKKKEEEAIKPSTSSDTIEPDTITSF